MSPGGMGNAMQNAMQNADIADIADISFLSNVVIHVVKCSEPDPLLLGAVGA